MITENYRDIEIVLLEEENKWRFTANGRERTAPTLPKAREFIDNALDAVNSRREKPWEPFQAYRRRGYHSEEFDVVTVTSLAERGRWKNVDEYWIKGKNGRDKVSVDDLYALSEANTALIKRIAELDAERERIDTMVGEQRAQLERIIRPAEVK